MLYTKYKIVEEIWIPSWLPIGRDVNPFSSFIKVQNMLGSLLSTCAGLSSHDWLFPYINIGLDEEIKEAALL